MKVLIVEDDHKLSGFLLRTFSEERYQVDLSATGTEALQLATTSEYDLIILDWMLPGQDGLSVCRELRRVGFSTPVLMLTARAELGEKVTALDSGVDDYVTKPFHLEELLARARALVRRGANANPGVVRLGAFVLDRRRWTVHVRGVRLDLTPREFSLLALLMRFSDNVVTRPEILSAVFELRGDPTSNMVEVHIRHLRDKLGPMARCVETVRGQGYRFTTENGVD